MSIQGTCGRCQLVSSCITLDVALLDQTGLPQTHKLACFINAFCCYYIQPPVHHVCTCRPHAFKAVYAVTLHGELLRTDLRIINTGDKPFEFTAALHTYIEVLDIKKASVKGLKDLEYLDKVQSRALSGVILPCRCCVSFISF